MFLEIAIVADDLTGAIDTATPFAQCGMSVAVALSPDHLDKAMKEDPVVLTVATGTRHVSEAEAQERLLHTTDLLRRFSPRVYFKKIDSRLKGNVVAESVAMLRGLQRDEIALVPAIPEQGRLQRAGHVTGMGVDQPIPLPAFPASIGVHAPDIVTQADLSAVAAQILADPHVLAVGARGLGQALAKHLARGTDCVAPIAFEFPLLIAVGSRDPITIRQMEHLTRVRADVTDIVAPKGEVPAIVTQRSPVTLVRCIEAGPAEDGATVACRFGEGIAALIERQTPRTLIASGGDTAAAILRAAGVDTLHPIGEIEASLPISSFNLGGRTAHLITKSGGFGAEDVLSEIVGGACSPA
ncbi:four-carbon acid sugar kinase family protein [Rhizobium calliandrae]|uniref:Four-carbon acid sugar kinase family protein n=1 Tax=Rhizobium calliandrae TaxID=1312182 RepID=A0ABT7KK03_9HYPH|nr:four-carbon acid sugar kinase family protein [Rhizobium calliandrae]MDL2408969.1 four-carbon acid sugar kinase family protein [Rhizobium calliandrae]